MNNITDKLAASLQAVLADVDAGNNETRADSRWPEAHQALAEYRAHPTTKLRQAVTGKIERGEAEPILNLEHFTVIAVSSNTNSFGYKSVILLSETGEGWEILKQAYGTEELPEQGDKIKRVGGRFEAGTYSSPRRLKDTTPKVAKKVIADATRK